MQYGPGDPPVGEDQSSVTMLLAASQKVGGSGHGTVGSHRRTAQTTLWPWSVDSDKKPILQIQPEQVPVQSGYESRSSVPGGVDRTFGRSSVRPISLAANKLERRPTRTVATVRVADRHSEPRPPALPVPRYLLDRRESVCLDRRRLDPRSIPARSERH